jgi:hypothetical protein
MRFIGAGSRPGQPHVDRDLVFTVPNFLTVLRFMGVPLFIWLVLARREYGFAVLVLAIPEADRPKRLGQTGGATFRGGSRWGPPTEGLDR